SKYAQTLQERRRIRREWRRAAAFPTSPKGDRRGHQRPHREQHRQRIPCRIPCFVPASTIPVFVSHCSAFSSESSFRAEVLLREPHSRRRCPGRSQHPEIPTAPRRTDMTRTTRALAKLTY